jgi:Rho termination factor, N-terminal domain
MEEKTVDPNEGKRAPAPETIDHQKEHERLTKEDRERWENQGSKEAGAATKAATAEPEDYESQTVVELKELAHKRGIEITSDMRKDEIIAALEEG